ncbi:MAG: cysteine--tRNA ligase [Patescibacteria group bacterium]
MKIYNTLRREKEEFVPIKEGEVSIYACGVTPYKPSHLGHAMQAVIFDIMRRYFEYKGYKVTYVRNYTDIDDKIINAAKEIGVLPLEHSRNIMEQSNLEFDELRIRRADHEPKVSETIGDIISFIEELLEKGMAYTTEKGNVYFDVKKFQDYGKLSNQKIEELRHGTRKEVEEDKKDAVDFALWKSSLDEGFSWDSPWGKGRPGWHIECSAMSRKFLGQNFDIHGGGGDLVFPHHENEIAQSEAVTNGKFANYWIHNGLLMVGNDKMSKSLGNDMSIEEWLRNYHEETIRYLIVTNHYRSHVQFAKERYGEANNKVFGTYKTLERALEALKGRGESDAKEIATEIDGEEYENLIKEFEESMDNDFNTVLVVAQIHEVATKINTILDSETPNLAKLEAYVKFIREVGKVLGLFDLEPSKVLAQMRDLELKKKNIDKQKIISLVAERDRYKTEGNYGEADKVRNELLSSGISLSDTKSGTLWDVDI